MGLILVTRTAHAYMALPIVDAGLVLTSVLSIPSLSNRTGFHFLFCSLGYLSPFFCGAAVYDDAIFVSGGDPAGSGVQRFQREEQDGWTAGGEHEPSLQGEEAARQEVSQSVTQVSQSHESVSHIVRVTSLSSTWFPKSRCCIVFCCVSSDCFCLALLCCTSRLVALQPYK